MKLNRRRCSVVLVAQTSKKAQKLSQLKKIVAQNLFSAFFAIPLRHIARRQARKKTRWQN